MDHMENANRIDLLSPEVVGKENQKTESNEFQNKEN